MVALHPGERCAEAKKEGGIRAALSSNGFGFAYARAVICWIVELVISPVWS
jgi:hypothetical protein